MLTPSHILEDHAPVPGPECISASLTSAFILQTYAVSHKAVLLINYSDSDFFDFVLLTVSRGQRCLTYLSLMYTSLLYYLFMYPLWTTQLCKIMLSLK